MICERPAMIFRYSTVSFRLALLLLVGVVAASAGKAPSAKPFERFDACRLSAHEWADGDSFPCAFARWCELAKDAFFDVYRTRCSNPHAGRTRMPTRRSTTNVQRFRQQRASLGTSKTSEKRARLSLRFDDDVPFS